MNRFFRITIFFIFLSMYSCASSQNTPQPQQQQTVPVPSVSPQPPPASAYWSGDGGRGIQLAVLEPAGKGLSATEQYIPSMIQSSITGDFHKYSAMTIVDRQNLEKIIGEQRQSLSGDYSDDDYIRIGRLTNARYILAGSVTKTTSAYMLELAVTDAQSGERKASYPPKGVSLLALENQSAIKEATAELLGQLGVSLTEQGRRELNVAANTSQVQAETALAKGIAAQKQGTVVEALSYFIQAANYDTGLAEAANRMNVLTANISSGNIGEDTRNDIAWRRDWVARLRETETFFANTLKEPQPFYIVYSTNIQKGNKIDYQKETIELSTWMGFYPDFTWSDHINGVFTAVKNGLQATQRAQAWELDWPAKTITSPSPFVNQTKNSTSTVVVEIINEQGKSIGRQTVRAPYGFEVKNTVVTPLWQWEGNVSFPAVDANSITDTLTIRIASIDGIAAESAVQQKKISIMLQAEWHAVQINEVALLQRADEYMEQYSKYFVKNSDTARAFCGRAIEVYSIAIGISPNNAEALKKRGYAYSSYDDYDKAIADYNQAIRLNPNDAEAYTGRGLAYSLADDYNKAIADYTQAIRLNPNDAEAYNNRGLKYLFNDDYDKAIADYTQAIKLEPNEARRYNRRGFAYGYNGKRNKAIADYTQGIRLAPNDAWGYTARGLEYTFKSKWNKAIADYTQAIRLDPNYARAYIYRGDAYYSRNKRGDLDRAIADYEAALLIDPNNADIRPKLENARHKRDWGW